MIEKARAAEVAKYVRCYANDGYRMGEARKADAVVALNSLPMRGSYLDVACGRGEMLVEAAALGFTDCRGTEVVPALIDGTKVVHGPAHALPFGDNAFDVATMLDVIEHLIPGDDESACRELARVAQHYVLIAASNVESNHGRDNLHINKRRYEEWDALFRTWFPGRVIQMKVTNRISRLWRVDLR